VHVKNWKLLTIVWYLRENLKEGDYVGGIGVHGNVTFIGSSLNNMRLCGLHVSGSEY